MTLDEVLTIRKSCRKFSNIKMDQNQIDKILWAGGRAPYASGGPRREFIVIRDNKTKAKLRQVCFGQIYVEKCDTVIVLCGKEPQKKLRSGFPRYIHNCDASAMCMILMATSFGLGTCWIGHFIPGEVQKIIGTEDRPVIVLVIGYPEK